VSNPGDADPAATYRPRVAARQENLRVRGLNHHVHVWGDRGAPPVLMLHGWADTGLSFQFLAEELADRWCIMAPDWRGFGGSDWSPGGYWIPDYLADLERFVDEYCADGPARIVGHSMGGNIAWVYAGIRPDRVGWAASLDAIGLPDSDPRETPARYARWLDQWRETPRYADYESPRHVAARVLERAPRLDAARAAFIAASWTQSRADGRLELRHDPGHKRINPVLYRRAEVEQCWRQIRARTLLITGRESPFREQYAGGGGERCRECIAGLEEAAVDAGHMLHWEQPREVAALLNTFLSRSAPGG
jgi:pimeloyl-ACP methyl ester carboxylesterase